MRVVLDTNLLVSPALVQGGRLAPIWDAWREGRFEVLVCDELLAEVGEVLQRPKLARYVDDEARAVLLRNLRSLTLHVTLSEPFPPFEDAKDRFLLALVRDGRAPMRSSPATAPPHRRPVAARSEHAVDGV